MGKIFLFVGQFLFAIAAQAKTRRRLQIAALAVAG